MRSLLQIGSFINLKILRIKARLRESVFLLTSGALGVRGRIGVRLFVQHCYTGKSEKKVIIG